MQVQAFRDFKDAGFAIIHLISGGHTKPVISRLLEKVPVVPREEARDVLLLYLSSLVAKRKDS